MREWEKACPWLDSINGDATVGCLTSDNMEQVHSSSCPSHLLRLMRYETLCSDLSSNLFELLPEDGIGIAYFVLTTIVV